MRKRARPSDLDLVISSGIFDSEYYSTCRQRQFASIRDAVADYFETWKESGANPNFYFHSLLYERSVPSISESGTNPLVHFLSNGIFDRLNPSPYFHIAWYLESYPHVAKSGANPLVDYLLHGIAERRDPFPLFDTAWYLREYPDVARTGEDPFRHYLLHGAHEGRFPNPLFDSRWYLSAYPDVADAGDNPLVHYFWNGTAEGRRPNPVFDGAWYSANYLADTPGLNPLMHYLRVRPSREPLRFPDFDPIWYRHRYPEVAQTNVDPLCHYVRIGRHEGRLPMRETLVLAQDYAAPAEEFDACRDSWLKTCRDSWLKSRRRSDLTLAEMPVRFVIRVADPGTPSALQVTLDAIGRLIGPPGCDITTVVVRTGAGGENPAVRVGAAGKSGSSPEREFVLFLQAGDEPEPEMLPLLLARIAEDTRLVLFDGYFVEAGRAFPMLLPGVNPVHALNVDYFRSRFLLDGTVLRSARIEPGSRFNPHDVALRVFADCESPRSGAIVHVAIPLLRLVVSSEAIADERRSMVLAGKSARFAFDAVDSAARLPTVSIVVCTKDNEHLVQQLVRSILAAAAVERIAEIIVVPSAPESPYMAPAFDRILTDRRLKLRQFNGPFNFSAKCNLGAEGAAGDILLFLNDDIVPVTQDWLMELLAPFSNPGIAVAGPLLVYPNAQVQHCGLYVGANGVTGHALRFARLPEHDYMFLGSVPRNVSVVTGAALAIRQDVFRSVNGFDEQLANYIQDVDLCLRVLYSGHAVVLNPRSILIHAETTTLKEDINHTLVIQARGREFEYFMRRWRAHLDGGDPYHNPRMLMSDESLRTLVFHPISAGNG